MARGQSSQGQGCTEYLGLSRPTPHPNPGPPVGGRCLAQSAQVAQRLGKSHTLGGPSAHSPAPAARGRCRTVPARLGRNAD